MIKKYTNDHEYIVVEGPKGKVGITSAGAEELGDLVAIELPEAGRTLKKGEIIATVESVKATQDVKAPVSGTIVEVNEALGKNLELLSSDPEGEGWIAVLEIEAPKELDALLDEDPPV